ncbi:DUF1156 domain-containing protein [Deinococcus daejeonensis]|uniref:DUF1156 domain-containing protein n=1 Tax=Deinococcus daejeonensis TaxID=1007098 RepID=A0ABQ2JES1_9DEIO|nr:DUF1156 domain-containing protein [Deinococcus daejeonensis]GGN46082.1 hypothetical protein GCM10010842_36290 [Deinococcus daejeonensis]
MTTEPAIKSPRKLIEVALPLDAINAAAAREKSIRHGHPSTLHLWWARRPLAAARAVIFAQMVNDPGYQQGGGFKYGKNKQEAAVERERLFKIIEDLVKWENTTNEEVLERARAEIRRSWREVCALNKDHPRAAELFDPEKLPAFHDPFAGGGAIPLEAQRLGLESYASDLNPVAVTINKAMIEIPPRFAGQKPVGPIPEGEKQLFLDIQDWSDSKGLAEDVRRYGAWMRNEAQKRIGHLYPKIKITPELIKDRPDLVSYEGEELTVIAWLWARTIHSPNPAYSHVPVPLSSNFILSRKEGKEFYVHPVVEGDRYRFEVKTGKPPEYAKNGTKLGRGASFKCLMSQSPIEPKHIYSEAKAGRMGERLMAIVAEGKRGRVYLSPTDDQAIIAAQGVSTWKPTLTMPSNPRWFSPPAYGIMKFGDLFTSRQLFALNTFSELAHEAIEIVEADAKSAGMSEDDRGLEAGGSGSRAYAEAIASYLGLSASKMSMFLSVLSRWRAGEGKTAPAFGRQAIPMVWDFADINPFAGAGGDFYGVVEGASRAIESFKPDAKGYAFQEDAKLQSLTKDKVVSTDPPYYDNIGYADLSDYFYVWLKRATSKIWPSAFTTLAVPKSDELVATPYRHGGTENAESFFLEGMQEAMERLAQQSHPAYPVSIYYAFKQSESDQYLETTNSGWDTFLEAVIRSGFSILGTWPMRTENATRLISSGTNALASSIVLVCRKRDIGALTISRREFQRELNSVLPDALDEMTRGGVNSPVAPVDLSQAIIGPGMAIFSKYKQVLEANGEPMSVRTALQLINRFLAEDDFDRDTQFCLAWFEQYGWGTEVYGNADVLARAKGTSVDGLRDAGVVEASGGRVRLLRWRELPSNWTPGKDNRTPVWEALHQIIRILNDNGETEAGKVLAQLSRIGEPMRSLAYRLYTLCERKGWAEDAGFYNEVATAWAGMERAALEESMRNGTASVNTQPNLFDGGPDA